MTIVAAMHLGAKKIFAVDTITNRLEHAQRFGAIPVNISSSDFKQEILQHTNGRGADAVMEVVGSPDTLRLAIDLLRPGGIISSVGVHTSKEFSFSPGEAYDKNLTYKIGRCPAKYYADKLLREEVVQRYPIESIITHRFSLKEGAKAYEIFDKKLDGCVKPILLP
jgi:threonine dehydrogenase-like Zn-dependent dehydrogenase